MRRASVSPALPSSMSVWDIQFPGSSCRTESLWRKPRVFSTCGKESADCTAVTVTLQPLQRYCLDQESSAAASAMRFCELAEVRCSSCNATSSIGRGALQPLQRTSGNWQGALQCLQCYFLNWQKCVADPAAHFRQLAKVRCSACNPVSGIGRGALQRLHPGSRNHRKRMASPAPRSPEPPGEGRRPCNRVRRPSGQATSTAAGEDAPSPKSGRRSLVDW